MRKKKFKRIVKYVEKRRNIPFGIKSENDKIVMIIIFILLFPFVALMAWIDEFTRLIQTKKYVHWEEISEKNSKANKK